jgi:hypothetical protein
MNNMIVDLYEKASEWALESDSTQSYKDRIMLKFAELIVRECIDTAFHKGHPDLEFLLKHFGVEE